MLSGGNNIGRVGTIIHRVRHHGGFDIIHVRDSNEKTFATRIGNVFVIGQGSKPVITLCKDEGIYFSAIEAKLHNK